MALKWWQTAVFYQIYPRSFADGNGDGIGDFIGMTNQLEHLVDLGIDAVWLSPHFPSSNWDVGYDIKNYCDVAEEYGTLEDFKAFLSAAHAHGIKVILDLVANHTSDEHAWFLESKSSRTNPKADWYIWQDTPPNNWQSCFDGDAWTYCPERDQYYYHFFMKQQPDLNWRNPEVIEAMWQAVRFWLDLGVDGYRLDAIATLYEDPDFTPHVSPYSLKDLRLMEGKAKTAEEFANIRKQFQVLEKYQVGQPGVHERMKELRAVLDEYPGDRMLVGEDDNPDYLGNGSDELHLVFNFPLMRTKGILTPAHIIANQEERLKALAAISADAWPCNTLGNHDCPRVYNQFGDGIHDAELARISAALMLTLKGTPFFYNGEEIGMTDLIITDPTLLRDTMATWYYEQLISEPDCDLNDAALKAGFRSRDKNRTPMQWNKDANAGFSPAGVTTWLPVNPNFETGVNVAEQVSDPSSLLSFYKKMIHVRKNNPALIEGGYTLLPQSDQDLYCFLRSTPGQTLTVCFNFSPAKKVVTLSTMGKKEGKVIFSSAGRGNPILAMDQFMLGSYEILIIEV